jgi:peptidoglycan/LPS O-acetylase OafA/YrhL
MSGIVLCRAYDEKLQSSLSAGRFMVLRYARLAPSYLLALVLSAVLTAQAVLRGRMVSDWTMASIAGAAALGVLFLPARSHKELYALNTPS